MTLKAETLRALAEKATPGPWAYRPDEHDDWGMVKSPRQAVEGFKDGLRCCLAQFRHPDALDEEVLSKHRAAKTDPWRGNAELVTYLRNAVPEILALLEADKDERVAALEAENGRMREALTDADQALAAMSDQWTSGWFENGNMYAHEAARKAEREAKQARAHLARALRKDQA